MPDWKKIVCEKLSPLPLENQRQEEIIEELAQQLEGRYEDARASGASEPEALRQGLAQFGDWETLRREICRAVEGDDLPVLLEGGVRSRRWIPTWIALGLSLALFVLPAFRHAVSAAAAGWGVTQWSFSGAVLERLAREGAAQHDAHTLAFVALHELDLERAGRSAEQAVALDSRLAWVYSRFVTAYPSGHDAAPWIARLKAADPGNAFPALLEAGWIAETRMLREQSGGGFDARLRQELAKDDAWRQAMERAFAAPRYDSYTTRRFDLDRRVLAEHGLDRPEALLYCLASQRIPNPAVLKLYSDFLVEDLGEPAEAAGRFDEALRYYASAAQFGERMQTSSSTDIEHLMGIRLQEQAYQRSIPLLRRQGKTAEAAAAEKTRAQIRQQSTQMRDRTQCVAVGPGARAARLVWLQGGLMAFFALATAFWLGCFAFALAHRQGSRKAPFWLTPAVSAGRFAPLLLFLTSVGLLASFYPYAASAAGYRTANALWQNFWPFWANLMDQQAGMFMIRLWARNLFWPGVWCIAVAVAGWLVLREAARCRAADQLREE